MYQLFYNNDAFDSDIDNWDVSQVTNMRETFSGATAFGQSDAGQLRLESWNTAQVTDMQATFFYATAFNGNIAHWNVAKVMNFHATFEHAESFNRDVDGWNVAAATEMSYMFKSAEAFNQAIGSWNLASVTVRVDEWMSGLEAALRANEDAECNGRVSRDNLVRQLLTNFQFASTFNGLCPPHEFKSKAALETAMIAYCADPSAAEQGPPFGWGYSIDQWDVSRLTDLSNVNAQCRSAGTTLSGDIDTWNVAQVTDMTNFLSGVSVGTDFNHDLASWNVAQVTSMSQMFAQTRGFNADIGGWNVAKVTDFSAMFWARTPASPPASIATSAAGTSRRRRPSRPCLRTATWTCLRRALTDAWAITAPAQWSSSQLHMEYMSMWEYYCLGPTERILTSAIRISLGAACETYSMAGLSSSAKIQECDDLRATPGPAPWCPRRRASTRRPLTRASRSTASRRCRWATATFSRPTRRTRTRAAPRGATISTI